MRLPLRETGSILVQAPRERVFDRLRRDMAHAPGLRATPDRRLESAHEGATYVLRDEAGGTRLYHARNREGLFLSRDELRAAVHAELLRVQRLAQE